MLNKRIEENVCVFAKTLNENLEYIDDGYGGTFQKTWRALATIRDTFKENDPKATNFDYSWLYPKLNEFTGYYWSKSEFFDFEPIKVLGLEMIEDENCPISDNTDTTKLENSSTDTAVTNQHKDATIPQYDYKFFLFKKPLLTFHEASCIMTGYDPRHVEQCQNDTNFKQNFSNYLDAKDYLGSCIDAHLLAYDTYSNQLEIASFKDFLAKEGTFIEGFNDNLPQQDNYIGNPTIGHASPEHYQQQCDQLQKENNQLKDQLAQAQQQIKELEEMQSAKNAIINDEITLKDSDLLFIAVLMENLRNAITVKANKSQARILQKIENENNGITGLSKSRTDKLMGEANKIYKSLKNKQMK